MYSRFLFVGLGGSGGKTLRFLKKELLQWQRQHGIDEPLPKGWQFLNIDTPNVSDGKDIDERVDPLPPDEYLGLVNAPLQFGAVQGSLDQKPDLHEEMATWRVDPVGVSVPLIMGAGQHRAIGQTVAMFYAPTILRKLREHLTRLQRAEVVPELGKLYQRVTRTRPSQQSGIYIVVVSSLAGGTGAGLLNLVCDILRADGTAGESVFGLLYTPDVFEALGNSTTGGVQPNALAATSELMNGNWRKNSPSVANPVLAQAGVGKLISGSGPSFPFLVGRRNTAGIDFGTHDHAFEMTGRSLVSWVTASAAQSGLVSYTIGNWEMRSKSNTLGPVLVDEGGQDTGFPQFSALGFARVSVGGNYFEEYAKLVLARDANEHLADYHSNSDDAQRTAKSIASSDPEMISRTIAKEHRDDFLRSARLSEYGPDENQIIDALRPDESLEREFLERALELSGVRIGGASKLTIDQWRIEIETAVEQAQTEYLKQYESELADLANDWVESIQDSLLGAVEEQVSIRGLHVAKSLCEMAADHLKNAVAADLSHDAEKYRGWHTSWKNECTVSLENLSGSIDSEHESLDEAVQEAVHYAKFVGDKVLNERSADLCPEIADRLLTPMAEALSGAHATVINDKNQVDSWPTWDAPVPQKLAPPPGELTLIDADEYGDHFKELTKQSFPDKAAQERRSMVRRAVIKGDFLKSESNVSDERYRDLRCLSVQQNWWPSVRWLDPRRTASRLVVDVKAGGEHLKDRASGWLHRQNTPFSKFLDLNLRSYLGSDALFKDDTSTQQLEANTTRFVTQLTAAMRLSAPLLDIDEDLLGKVHPNSSDSHTRYFSQIPLQGHAAETSVRQVLESEGIDTNTIGDILGNDASLRHIDITSTLHSPHSVLVMKSLVRPIAAAWNRAKGSPLARYTFWNARRGQPLEKFVPVPQSMLLCMIRGWFTGALLGHIEIGDGEKPVRISEAGRTTAEFPHPFLTVVSDQTARLPQVLEALPLAYAEIGHTANLAPLDPYIALRDLGKSASGADLYDYRDLNSVLKAWIGDGSYGTSIVEPHRMITVIEDGLNGDPNLDSSYQRAAELARLFHRIRESYQKRYVDEQKSWQHDHTKMSKAPLWTGLWHPISKALEQLETACEEAARNLTSEADDII